MARQLDWSRTKPGHEGYDEKTGIEWRRGPSEDSASGIKDSDISDGIAGPPDIYWASTLARKFPYDGPSSHAALKAAAADAVARIYKTQGINVLMARTEAFYRRASHRKPFPSAWFAVYFDWAARRIALRPGTRHIPAPHRNAAKFFSIDGFAQRCAISRCKAVEEAGGLPGLIDILNGNPCRRPKI